MDFQSSDEDSCVSIKTTRFIFESRNTNEGFVLLTLLKEEAPLRIDCLLVLIQQTNQNQTHRITAANVRRSKRRHPAPHPTTRGRPWGGWLGTSSVLKEVEMVGTIAADGRGYLFPVPSIHIHPPTFYIPAIPACTGVGSTWPLHVLNEQHRLGKPILHLPTQTTTSIFSETWTIWTNSSVQYWTGLYLNQTSRSAGVTRPIRSPG